MEPSVYGLFLLIIIILIGSACCSGVEAAFLAVNSIRILEIASRQKPKSSANQLLKLRKHLGRTLTVITITNNGFNIIGSLILGVYGAFVINSSYGLTLFSIIFYILVVLVGEVLPKALGTRFSVQIALLSVPILRILNTLMRPFLILIEQIFPVITAENEIENIARKESITEEKTKIKKIHIVKSGDTISSIAKFYSVNKSLIIQLNNLKDENYIYVGQNLIISESSENSKKKSDLINNYHIVQIGESITEISNKYKLDIGYLIEINNLKNPDSIEVGQKLLLSKKEPISSDNYQITNNEKSNDLLESEKKIYGPIVIQSKSYETNKGRKILNVLNQENKKLILSINCDTNELDVRIPGRKWRGGKPAKEEFEKNLINDFC